MRFRILVKKRWRFGGNAPTSGISVMNVLCFLRSSLTCMVCLLVCVSSSAQDWERTIGQFQHTSWDSKQGAPGPIRVLAQTEDGYLWLGADHGLYRFDGMTFERYEPRSGGPLASDSVSTRWTRGPLCSDLLVRNAHESGRGTNKTGVLDNTCSDSFTGVGRHPSSPSRALTWHVCRQAKGT